jgi:hypothetical protein
MNNKEMLTMTITNPLLLSTLNMLKSMNPEIYPRVLAAAEESADMKEFNARLQVMLDE